MSSLRCGVIGCGRIGCGFDDQRIAKTPSTHAGSYHIHPNTKLIALCDIDKKKLKKYGKKYSVLGLYTKSSEMFRNENLDCVSICTLIDSHLSLVKEAVEYGIKGIFLEKPISNDINTARKIISLCKKNNVKLLINHQRRFDPYYHQIKKFIHSTKIDSIQTIDVYYGGGIANTGSHLFDILRFFFGEINLVQGKFSTNKSTNKLDPNVDGLILFKNGLICNLHAVDVEQFLIFEIDILGSSGRLCLNMIGNTFDFQYFRATVDKKLGAKILASYPIKFRIPSKSSIYYGVENLVQCITSKKSPLCSGEDGYKSLETILGILRSCKENKEITLPLKNNNHKIKSK